MEEQTTALTLPDEATFKRDIQAINRFQQVVHSTMVEGLDYGVIPGTQKPTLLKPGAEKIAKLLGLADTYEILDKAEEWQSPFFRYLVKCKLIHVGMDVTISEGMGECNSMEAKYRWRWVSERDLPPGVDKTKLVSQERRSTKTGGHWLVFRMDNDDIYSQVNTILKMAKKRALVDAALSAGRLSDVFSQDLEDLPPQTFTAEKQAERARKEQPKPQAKTAVAAPEEEPEPLLKPSPDDTQSQSSPVKYKPSSYPPDEAEQGIETPVASGVEPPVARVGGEPEEDTWEKLSVDIAEKMNWANTKAVKSWIINRCKIPEEKLDDIPAVRDEVWALQGWTK